MDDVSYEIGLAKLADVTGILELQEQNLARSGGSLSVPFAREWFENAIADKKIVSARKGDTVVGYVVFSSFAAQAHVPLVQSMLRAYPVSANAYNYGPVCVSAAERGRGVARRMFSVLRELMPEREAVAFIREDNTGSIAAHEKMGMQRRAGFSHEGRRYLVFSYKDGGPGR